MVIGIEGLVGAGKTSICRELIKELPNTVLLNGGNLYRAIVYAIMQNGKNIEDLKKTNKNLDIKEMMDLFNINLKIEDNETIIYIENKKIDEELLQSKDVSLAVSTVGGKADNKQLFAFARELIDDLKKDYNVIISGRSIMKIYPDTDYHFFVVADLDERVKRRLEQNKEKGIDMSESEIRDNIAKRDYNDMHKKVGALKKTDDQIYIDTSNMTIDEVVNKIVNIVKEKN